jgi:phage gp29-like protein
MHRDKTSFFLMALEATSDNIAETFTSHLLKRWVDYNWRVDEYPRMKYSKLDTRDTSQLAEAVNKLVTAGAMTPGEDTERELRVQLDLPDESRPYEVEMPDMEPEEPEMAENGDRAAQIARLKAEAAALGMRLRPGRKAVA